MTRSTRSQVASFLALAALGGVVALRAITEPKNDFRFSIIGDRTGSAQPQLYGRVWREVDLLHPDFVINVGDTIQGGNDAIAEAQWLELRPLFQRYNHYPLYFTPGNHDVFSDTSRQLYEKASGRPLQYSFNYQDAHFTVLDNSRTTDLTAEQLEFLARDLEANKDKNPKFIFFHKPYWIPMLKLGASDFPLHKLALKYDVKHVISGHGHQFVRLVRDGVAYMEVGSSGGTMEAALKPCNAISFAPALVSAKPAQFSVPGLRMSQRFGPPMVAAAESVIVPKRPPFTTAVLLFTMAPVPPTPVPAMLKGLRMGLLEFTSNVAPLRM